MSAENVRNRAWTLAAAWVLLSSGAMAGSAQDAAAARALFDQGRTLVKAGDYAKACPKFEESYKLEPGIGAAYHMADCYEQIGRTASAWSGFLDAASKARLAGQADREQIARDRAKALEPRLTNLLITVEGGDLAGLQVRRDDTPIGKGMWGQAVPVDPGEHTVMASATAHKPWKTTVSVTGEGKTISVKVPMLERDESAAPNAITETTQAQAQRNRGGGQRLAGIVVGGAGIVSLGVAGLFALQTRSKVSDAEAFCSGNQCWDQRGIDLHHDARGSADLATVFSIVGAVGVVGGAALYLTAPKAGTESSARKSPALVAGPMSIGVRGVW